MFGEDSYLDAFMEDHISGGPHPELPDEDDRDFDDSAFEEDEEYDEELARDQILERQELEDFEGLSPFEDFDVGGEGDW